jgi:hypothetical protein
MAAGGENRWPYLGRNRWPLTGKPGSAVARISAGALEAAVIRPSLYTQLLCGWTLS